jgi:hypothetical protein
MKHETKCFANVHLKCGEFGFWEVCRSLSFPFEHNLIFDGRTLAANFAGEGKDHIYRLAKRLCETGWFVCLKQSKRGSKGTWEPAVYRVLSHEEWAQKNGKSHCKKPRKDRSDPFEILRLAEPYVQSRIPEQSSLNVQNNPVENSRTIQSGKLDIVLSKGRTDQKACCPTGILSGEAAPEEPGIEKKEMQKMLSGEPNVPPVADSRLDASEPAPEHIPSMTEILAELPDARQRKLYNRNHSYTRAEAWAELQAYREEQKPAVAV